jgi:hypothetical protein
MSSSSTTNQGIGPTSNSYNTAARDNTIISGNKTTVNSNNTTTNSHTYQDSNVHIGAPIFSMLQWRIAFG